MASELRSVLSHEKVLDTLRTPRFRDSEDAYTRPIPGQEKLSLDSQSAIILERFQQLEEQEHHQLWIPSKETHYPLHRLGAWIGERMWHIDRSTGRSGAGLVALREVLRRPGLDFEKVEEEIRAGKHDAAIEEVRRIVSEELRRGREKPFKRRKR